MARKKWVEGWLAMYNGINSNFNNVVFLPTKSMNINLIFNKRDKNKKWGCWREQRNPEEKLLFNLSSFWYWHGNIFMVHADKFHETYDTPWLKPGTKFLVDLEV